MYFYAGITAAPIREKVIDVFAKNKGLHFLTIINQRLLAEPLTTIEVDLLREYTPQEIALYSFAPITSAEVERSFSLYKNILTDRRRSFTFENLKKFFILNCYFSTTAATEGNND